jgi:hypothetical protein
LTEASDTVLTELFGMGWPSAPHRVLRNEATERWLRRDRRGPAAVRTANSMLAPVLSRVPIRVQERLAGLQSARGPLLSPMAVTEDRGGLVESGPLYAGESVARMGDIRPAGAVTRELAVFSATS